MITLAFAASSLLSIFISIIVIALIFWLLWWLVGYIKLPEPFNKVVRVILAVFAVIVLITVILNFSGNRFIVW